MKVALATEKYLAVNRSRDLLERMASDKALPESLRTEIRCHLDSYPSRFDVYKAMMQGAGLFPE